MRRLVLSLAVALALGGGVAIAQTSAPSTPAPGSSAAKAAPSPEPSPVSTIHIKNFAFVPDTVTIHPGSTVRFVQDDETPHTVTAADHSFDSGNLNQKDTWKHTFAKEGTYKYLCSYHPYMKGTVIVK
jgi:plastocyanin